VQFSGYWTGRIPDRRQVRIEGELPPVGQVVALRLFDPEATGVYRIVRKGKMSERRAAPSPERDAEIVRLRQEGRTLQSIGDEFGLCRDRIRYIAVKHERLLRNPARRELSVRAINAVLNVPGVASSPSRGYWGDGFAEPLEAVAQKVAEAGRSAFVGRYNCGRKTITELEAWIAKYGFSWGAARRRRRFFSPPPWSPHGGICIEEAIVPFVTIAKAE
jgi:hypothetical protein